MSRERENRKKRKAAVAFLDAEYPKFVGCGEQGGTVNFCTATC